MKRTGIALFFEIILKLLAFLGVFIGIGFIVFGCVLQSPPKAGVPVMLVVVGVFTFIAAVCGYIGSRFRSLFLTIYLIAGSIATLVHAVMILVCFFAFEHVVARIDAIDIKDSKLISRDSIKERLKTGAWVFIWIVVAEAVSLGLAFWMRFQGELEGAYDTVEDAETAAENRRMVAMGALKSSSYSAKGLDNRAYDRTAAKMDRKYGKFSHAVDFMEGRRWYNFFRKE
ncbi:hypothetical protein WJX84_004809 [Apatococcus fuscideae]|uniref:Uncharacterized protein n=1 Tax=Apatococcus fuscideae TaxID=2026836 RepID=A0AAW1SYB7_9CHLO